VLVVIAACGAGLVALVAAARHRQAAAVTAARRAEYDLQVQRSCQLGPYLAMSAAEFERAIAVLLTRDGCSAAQVTGGAGDLGADVTGTAPDGRRIVIPCKRYVPGKLVTGPDLQKFGGTCFAVHGAHVATVVTTSGFTKQARDYAARLGIGPYDQDALAGWAGRSGPAPWHAPAWS
jgi:restriction system protein